MSSGCRHRSARDDDETSDIEVDSRLEVGGLERVAVVLLDQRLARRGTARARSASPRSPSQVRRRSAGPTRRERARRALSTRLQRSPDASRSSPPTTPFGRRRRGCGVRAVLECRHCSFARRLLRSTHRKTPARVASQLSTAVASTSMRRSGSPSAATPMRVIGFSGSIPAVAAARMAPSPSAAILSGVQSTT